MTDRPPGSGQRAEAYGERTPDASMSLLNDLQSRTLDEDYAPAAARRAQHPGAHRPGSLFSMVVVLALFGLMVATAALQTNRAAPAVRQEREQLIERIDQESQEVENLRTSVSSLEGDVARLEDSLLSRSRAGQALQGRLQRLGVLSGTQPVTGPGVLITVDDAPDAESETMGQVLDTDLQKLVNALWVAGAEAISIDNQRITSRSAIRGAGSAITVNYRSLTRPYLVRAIGNPDTLPARLLETEGGRAWLDLQVNFGIEFSTETRRVMTVPGGAPSASRFAEIPRGGRR